MMNENITELIISAAHELSSKGDINQSLIPNRKALGLSILSTEYRRMLTTANAENDSGEKLTGNLVAKPDSWLSLVKIDNEHSVLDKFHMSALDSATMGNISTRFKEEVRHYENHTLAKIKNYIFKIKNYVTEANAKTTTVADMLSVVFLTRPVLLDTLSEKRWLDRKDINMADPLTLNLLEIDAMKATDFTSDMELQLVFKDAIESLTEVETDILNSLIHTVEVGAIETKIEALDITDIKPLAVFVAKLRNATIGKKSNEFEFVINMAIDKLNRIDASYRSNLKINNVVCAYNRVSTNEFKLFIISETYANLDTKDLSILLGGVLKKTAGSNAMAKRLAVNLYKHEIDENNESYLALANRFKDSIIMTNKNNAVSSLREYYTFGIKGVMEADLTEVRQYVDGKPLHKLSDVDRMCYEIVRDVVEKDNNFQLFANCIDEAVDVLGDNVTKDVAVSYAGYKLALLYFIRQCVVI